MYSFKFGIVVSALFILNYCSAEESYLVDYSVEIERTGNDLEDSKKMAIYDGKQIAINNILESLEDNEENDKSEHELSADFVEECVDSYAINEEKFINNTYQATISYKINIEQLKRFLKKTELKNVENKVNVVHNTELNYDLSSGKEIMIIPVGGDLIKRSNYLYKLIGQDYLLSLYAITANSVKLYSSNRIKNLLAQNRVYFYMEVSK